LNAATRRQKRENMAAQTNEPLVGLCHWLWPIWWGATNGTIPNCQAVICTLGALSLGSLRCPMLLLRSATAAVAPHQHSYGSLYVAERWQ